MLEQRLVKTPALSQNIISTGNDAQEFVLFIHGNASSSVFWEEQMEMLAPEFCGIAVDLRGYGATEGLPMDATQGCRQWAEDIIELLDELKISSCHLVGHSMGGSAIYNLLLMQAERFKSVVLVAPASPFGFGGTKDIYGTPCYSDFAGTGGGTVNQDFARLMKEGDKSEENPQASPRVVMNSFYWKPPFRPEREEKLLDGLLAQRVAEDAYPGDFETSSNWPFVAPGKFGPVNASSPKYAREGAKKLMAANIKLPFLWIRGSDDQIVSDNSLFEMGTLGKLGLVPDYPGEEVYPPQPMIGQTRYFLEQLCKSGCTFEEIVMQNTGHTPFIEKADEFSQLLDEHLQSTFSI